jgi:MAF protein
MTDRILLLASASPRRLELIQLLKVPWIARAADVDEESVSHPDPAADVVKTAQLKAEYAAATAPENYIVIGADTTVVLDGIKLNKPAGEDEAREMLTVLRGRSHEVHTGLTIIDLSSRKLVADVSSVSVPMRYYSDSEIDAYIATGDPLDKAGAYAIQHPELRPVLNLRGCYATVVGLPLCHLVRALREVGMEIISDVPSSCQELFNYDCPVFDKILNGDVSFGVM